MPSVPQYPLSILQYPLSIPQYPFSIPQYPLSIPSILLVSPSVLLVSPKPPIRGRLGTNAAAKFRIVVQVVAKIALLANSAFICIE